MSTRRIIGGEFELADLRLGPGVGLEVITRGMAGTWTLSGRAALGLVLKQLQARGCSHVHLPAYLCQSLLQPVRQLGLPFSLYPVDTQLRAYPDPPPGSAVLLIHYFGWINPVAAELRAAGDRFHLVEDASQTMLSNWSTAPTIKRYVVLSLRKFGPIPLGGWCNIEDRLEEASPQTEALVWRSLAARLARGAYLAEPEANIVPAIERFYLEAFRALEEHLDKGLDLAAAPVIVQEIAAGLDWEEATRRRRTNWLVLHDQLGDCIEPLFGAMPEDVVPLGYVVRLPEARRDILRKKLAEARIYCPVHWPLPAEVCQGRFPEADLLARTCLTLPVDQRYGPEEMERMGRAIKAVL